MCVCACVGIFLRQSLSIFLRQNLSLKLKLSVLLDGLANKPQRVSVYPLSTSNLNLKEGGEVNLKVSLPLAADGGPHIQRPQLVNVWRKRTCSPPHGISASHSLLLGPKDHHRRGGRKTRRARGNESNVFWTQHKSCTDEVTMIVIVCAKLVPGLDRPLKMLTVKWLES